MQKILFYKMKNKQSRDSSRNNQEDEPLIMTNNEESEQYASEDPPMYQYPPQQVENVPFRQPFSNYLKVEQEESIMKTREAEERRRILSSKLKMPGWFRREAERKNFNIFFRSPGVFQKGMTLELMNKIISKEWSLLTLYDKLKYVNYSFSKQLRKKKQEEENIAKGRMRMQSHMQQHQQLHHKNIAREQSVAREISPQHNLIPNDRQLSPNSNLLRRNDQKNNNQVSELNRDSVTRGINPQVQLVGRISSSLINQNTIPDPRLNRRSSPTLRIPNNSNKIEANIKLNNAEELKLQSKTESLKTSKNDNFAEIFKKISNDPYKLPIENNMASFEARFKVRIAQLEGKHIDEGEPIPSPRERFELAKKWLNEIENVLKLDNIDIPDNLDEVSDWSDSDNLDELSKKVKKRDYKSIFKTEILDADDNLEQRTAIKLRIIEIINKLNLKWPKDPMENTKIQRLMALYLRLLCTSLLPEFILT